MSERPRISVAIPVLNGAKYLSEALASLEAQDDQDFEVAVSDNASTDATPDILARFASSRPNVVVSRSDHVLKQADNVNRAARLCSGEWIKFLCHDDLLNPQCISTLRAALGALSSDRVGVVGNTEEWLYANGVREAGGVPGPLVETWKGQEFLRVHLAGAAAPPVPSLTTALVRREAFEELGAFDNRFVHFDSFLWTRMMRTWDYAFVARVLTVNRIHPEQVFVEIRRTTRSIDDLRLFWSEFLKESTDLNLGLVTRLKMRLKPVGAASSYLAMELLKRRPGSALALAAKMPPLWWPLLPPLVFRTWRRESARVRQLAMKGVPASLIFPG